MGCRVKIRFDRERCTGHGRCYVLAAELFEEDDDGYCVVKQSEVPAASEPKARLAVNNCPEEALEIEA